MNPNEGRLQHQPSRSSSSSSAIDLTGTPTGLASSVPPSPSLGPLDNQNAFTRRRTSWGRVEFGQDPLRLDFTSGLGTTDRISHMNNDDPFYSPSDDIQQFGYHGDQYSSQPSISSTYATAQAAPSTASLIAPHEFDMDGTRDDDQAHLTTNMSHASHEEGIWNQSYIDRDPEQTASAGNTPRSRTQRRKAARYSTSPSPLKKTGTAIKVVSRHLRRMSLRVVNLAGSGLETQIRLVDHDGRDDWGGTRGKRREEQDTDESADDQEEDEPLPDLSKHLPIRGRTLGFMGPQSRVRLALYRLLIHQWTEPIILILIILNAVVLTMQTSRSLTLPTSDGTSLPPPVKGFFHTWEDYALFVLFIIFTLEAFARICVSGFLLDPEVPTVTLFSSPLVAHTDLLQADTTLSHQPSFTRPLGPLSRGLSLSQRLSKLNANLRRPFVLPNRIPSSSNSPPNGPDSRSQGPLPAVTEKVKDITQQVHTAMREPSHPTFFSTALRSDRSDLLSLPFRLSIKHAHSKTRRNVPYLRHSWSRIDFVAIVSFWISFALATGGLERGKNHIGAFRAMSVIRTARLLTITSGTTTIMHSLKTARPLLASVAYFVLFAMILFSIIGVQSFKGSLRRSCFLRVGNDDLPLDSKFCGGYVDPSTLDATSYIQLNGDHAPSVKGYICPLGQICQEQENPHNNVESFDTIYYAALQVIIVASANGWSPLMYSMINSEFFVSCFFFIICVIVLNFWLINLFVAVITNTFSAIRSQTQKSAFGAAPLAPITDDEGWSMVDGRRIIKSNIAQKIYDYTHWCWVLLALASLGLQASRTVDVGEVHDLFLYYGELAITFAFDVEIVIRFLATLPDWRSFFTHGNNWLDATLAIGSSIIQIPIIHDSSVYPWLTIFQLARFYRVILVVPRMKPLLLAVFGNMYGLANMSLFLILVNYIAALVGLQLLRGDMGQDQAINFGELFNAFIGVYQVFSSENWVDVLYGATDAETPLNQTIVVALFVAAWMLFANFIVLQMFIAVINENFDVAEEAKKEKQASKYWASHQPQDAKKSWIRWLNPYRWVKANPVRVKVENLPSNLILPMQKALVEDYTSNPERRSASDQKPKRSLRGPRHYSSKSLSTLQKLFAGDSRRNDVPLATLRHARSETLASMDAQDEETERHLELLAAVNSDAATSEDINDALEERRMQKADFIRNHPSYDKTFWIFSQKNSLRRICQKLVQPANGERIFGTPHSPIAHPIFQLVLLLTVIGGIVVETIATPLYRRNFFAKHGFIRGAWFDMAEAAFGFTLFVEFVIKIIADGFIFTPNAYVRSIWNILDLTILIGLLINITTSLIFIGGLSRLTRSLKALRALRLITLIDKMRDTFQSLIISGATRIMDAAVLAILYMIPYAVWGLNIFAGQMNQCNDGNASGLTDCINEYNNTFIGNEFGFLVPRVWENPSPSTTFSFDSFRSSLLILFEIVSLEGWIDAMGVAMSITGKDQQPQTNASQINALFFLIYNLLGGVVILTLFVSIIIGNFSSKTGSAFLTAAQREWIDLQKLFKRQKPSKRPRHRPSWSLRAWCFDRAVHKHGWWSRTMTMLFIFHIIVLMTQTYARQVVVDTFRNTFFVVMTLVYVIDTVVRLFGLGWRSFRANGWNLFDIVVAGGSFITTLVVRFGSDEFVIQQLQKLFLVSIAFKLIQRMNSLNKLFKTAMASLPVIISLLGLWFILFIFFAILFVEVFSMTKWNTAEDRNQNYSTMGSALVMLAFMSTGEGWNQYMHDYAIVYPRCTNSFNKDDSDCGSVAWAFTLFIAWNLLSMYIFLNMFTGVVVENFSYVFQTSAGGTKSVTRQQMRAFKKVWAEFANDKTGYLERHNFVPFFAKLSGVFEVKIYPTEHNIPNIMTACKESPESEYAWPAKVVDGIDLRKLDAFLSTIDYAAVRKRKAIYSRLYHEASISHHQGRGISFTDMLLLLAHHKLIVDRDALVLKDLVVRTETNKLVSDLVNLDRVRSLLKTISYRRRFLAYREQVRSMKLEQQAIPSIVVDGLPETPPQSTRDITSVGFDSPAASSTPWMSTPPSNRRRSAYDMSLFIETHTGAALQRSSRRLSDISLLSTADLGYRPRDSSPSAEDPFSSLINPMWDDMMQEAAEEENKQ